MYSEDEYGITFVNGDSLMWEMNIFVEQQSVELNLHKLYSFL
jgi:hypothetical protein